MINKLKGITRVLLIDHLDLIFPHYISCNVSEGVFYATGLCFGDFFPPQITQVMLEGLRLQAASSPYKDLHDAFAPYIGNTL